MNYEEFLGKTGKDIITGFTGVITGFTAYLTGCEQFLLTPRDQDKDGKPEARWVDFTRIEVDEQISRIEVRSRAATVGADLPAPIR